MSDSAVMTRVSVARPEAGEYDPYYERYISLVTGTDIVGTLESQRRQMLLLLSGCDEADAISAMPPRSGRRRKCSGMSATPSASSPIAPCASLAEIARPSKVSSRTITSATDPRVPLAEIIEDYIAVRRATLTLLRNLDEQAWTRRGIANKKEVTVRALAYITAGHELHHRRILEEKYFPAK